MTPPRNPFSAKSKSPSVQRLYTVWQRLHALRGASMSWRAIAPEFAGVPAATLCAIYKHGREPKKPAVRAALGLPTYAPAPVCPVHGIVHLQACPVAEAAPAARPKIKRPRPSYKQLAEAYKLLWLLAAAGPTAVTSYLSVPPPQSR